MWKSNSVVLMKTTWYLTKRFLKIIFLIHSYQNFPIIFPIVIAFSFDFLFIISCKQPQINFKMSLICVKLQNFKVSILKQSTRHFAHWIKLFNLFVCLFVRSSSSYKCDNHSKWSIWFTRWCGGWWGTNTRLHSLWFQTTCRNRLDQWWVQSLWWHWDRKCQWRYNWYY